MRLLLFLYAVFVVGPSALLAVWAWRGAGLERERLIAGRRDVVDGYAKLLASSAEMELAKAAREADESGIVGYAGDGGDLRYQAAAGPAPEPPGTPEDRRWYLLARRGGESFEAAGDPAAALDAYTFHLARIRAPELRARLRLAAARAARGMGEEALARGMLLELFETAGSAATDEGLPVDLVSASMLLEHGADPEGTLRVRASRRLAEKAAGLRTPLLARWMKDLSPEDERLSALVDGRRALEAAVAARPEILSARDAALAGSTAVFARVETAGGTRIRALRAAALSLADLPINPGVEVTWTEPGAPAAGDDVVARPFGLPGGGPPLGAVAVRDPGLASARRDQDRFRANRRLSVAAQSALILVGGLVILRYLRRERELARLRVRLLANVSHELKTPVTSIRMFAEMLASNGVDAARAVGFGRHILRESERLSRLVEDVLDTARPGRAREAFAPEPVGLAALLRGLASAFAERARDAGVDFRLEGADAGDPEITVETSAPAVERILSNLLDNALKYRRETGSRIVLSLERDGAGARVSVRDNGIGIARKDRLRVFDEFYRAKYDDYAVKGAGLGLAIARRLARELGGDLTLESREGEGSAFTLRLPGRAPVRAGAAPP